MALSIVAAVRDRLAIDAKVLVQLYNKPDFYICAGQNLTVVDACGKAYLDLTAGIAVSSLGHNHPQVTKIIGESSAFLHASNLFHHPYGMLYINLS